MILWSIKIEKPIHPNISQLEGEQKQEIAWLL